MSFTKPQRRFPRGAAWLLPYYRQGLAGRIAFRVFRTVRAFRPGSAVKGFPCVGRLSRLSDPRSPVEAMRSVVDVAQIVKEWRPCGLVLLPVFAGDGIKISKR